MKMGICLNSKSKGQSDVSVGKGTICVFISLSSSLTEFNTHNPHDVKGEMTPVSCPLVSI